MSYPSLVGSKERSAKHLKELREYCRPGQRIGLVTAVREVGIRSIPGNPRLKLDDQDRAFREQTSYRVREWEFRCDCGTIFVRRAFDFAQRKVTHCGCKRPRPTEKGDKFNRLTAVSLIMRDPEIWLWECDCGEFTSKAPVDVRNSKVKSCGCANTRAPIDLVGRHGHLQVLEEAGRDEKKLVLWKCRCDCGRTVIKNSQTIRRVKLPPSCGMCHPRERVRHE